MAEMKATKTGVEKIDIFAVFFQEAPAELGFWHVVAWRGSDDLKEFTERVLTRYSDRAVILVADPPHLYRSFHHGELREKVMCRCRLLVSAETRVIAGDSISEQSIVIMSPQDKANFPSVFAGRQPLIIPEKRA